MTEFQFRPVTKSFFLTNSVIFSENSLVFTKKQLYLEIDHQLSQNLLYLKANTQVSWIKQTKSTLCFNTVSGDQIKIDFPQILKITTRFCHGRVKIPLAEKKCCWIIYDGTLVLFHWYVI